MNKLLVALYDTQGYMRALAEYFGKKNFLLESRLFTKAESLNEFLKEKQPDVLLLGEDVDRSSLRYLDRAGHLVILSEVNCVSEGMGEYPLIFKYQSADTILKEIFAIMEGKENYHSAIGKSVCGPTEVLGIYHLYGAPLAVHQICQERGELPEKCLFVNMELFDGGRNGSRAAGEDSRGLSEMIFYLKQKNEKLALKLRQLVQQREGIDHLDPAADFRDLYSLSREDVDRLLTVLANETGYERVIFDIGFLTDTALYLLYCCDCVYIPKARNSWEESLADGLEKLLIREGLEEVVENIHYVTG